MTLNQNNNTLRRPAGFTLVEVMIVVAIIALLAVIAFPNFVHAREKSRNAAFIADLRTATTAFQMFDLENRGYPPNAGAGIVPTGMAPYLGDFPWVQGTPLGGRWNWDNNLYGYTAGVGVGSPQASDNQLTDIDRQLDNGDLNSGYFRSRPGGYVFVIED